MVLGSNFSAVVRGSEKRQGCVSPIYSPTAGQVLKVLLEKLTESGVVIGGIISLRTELLAGFQAESPS